MEIVINGDIINQEVYKTILSDKINEHLKEGISQALRGLRVSIDVPLQKLIEKMIEKQIEGIVETEFKEQLVRIVKDSVTEKRIKKVVSATWLTMLEKINYDSDFTLNWDTEQGKEG